MSSSALTLLGKGVQDSVIVSIKATSGTAPFTATGYVKLGSGLAAAIALDVEDEL